MEDFTRALLSLRPNVTRWQAPPTGTVAARMAALQWPLDGGEAPTAAEVAAEMARAPKLAAIEAEFATRLAAGLPYADKVLQVDESSQGRMTSVATLALCVEQGQAGMSWPVGFAWRMADNSFLPRTAAQMLSMAQAAAGYVLRLRVNRWALRDAVNDPEATAGEIEAVDVGSGWPQ